MNLCDDGHEEVCFDGRHCPVCDLMQSYKSDFDEHVQQIKDLNNYVDGLEKDLANKTTEYNDLFNEVKRSYPEFAI